jgi:hypothetical protein
MRLKWSCNGLAASAASLAFSGSGEWQSLIHYAMALQDAKRIFSMFLARIEVYCQQRTLFS